MNSHTGIVLYNNPAMKYLLLPQYKLLRHSIYIGIILLFWFAFGYRSIKEGFAEIVKLFAYALSYVVIVYFNLLVLMPRVLYKNKIWPYLLLTYASFIIGYVVQQIIYIDDWQGLSIMLNNRFDLIRDMIINGITFFMFCGIGWSFSMFKMWLTDEKRIQDLTTENLKAELSNLKNQVNPHFLFNVFNNLYVTSKTNPAKVPNMILDISDLMRYQLDECSKEKVPLDSEINYINNFLRIEKERKEDPDIQFSVEGKTNNIMVEPLLFVALVENAFKHGLSKQEKGYVFITLSTQNGNILHLNVRNSMPAKPKNDVKTRVGIGLDNLKKRLELSYPNRYVLDIVEKEDEFTANLELRLE